MKIAFFADHPYWGQLANNGGTRTVLLSVRALNGMRHDAYVVAHKDKFTWFPHRKPEKRMLPGTDVVVAVSISDVKMLMKMRPRGVRMAYWARPFEIWQVPLEKTLSRLRAFQKAGGIVMVNSGWQQAYLNKHNLPSALVYSGIDLEWWYDVGRAHHRPWTICCQYSTKPRKGWPYFSYLMDALGEKCRYVAFGTEKCKDNRLSVYIRNARQSELFALYNSADYMFCPNLREGFYNCAAEAALCGCLIVRLNYPWGGMDDWSNELNSCVCKSVKEVESQIDSPSWHKVGLARHAIVHTIGDRARNMERMVGVLDGSLHC